MTKYECPNLVQEKRVGSCIWKAFDITYGNAFLHVEHCVWLKATNAYNATALNNVMSVAVDKIGRKVITDGILRSITHV